VILLSAGDTLKLRFLVLSATGRRAPRCSRTQFKEESMMKRLALLAAFAILIATGGQAFATNASPMATPPTKHTFLPQIACANTGAVCYDNHECCSGNCVGAHGDHAGQCRLR
jgi:hypothetical protein